MRSKIVAESVGRALIGGTCIDSCALTVPARRQDKSCCLPIAGTGTVFVELPPWRRLVRGRKDDDAMGSHGLHRGHGVGGARRLGVHLPGHRQRGRPRHAQWRDRSVRCRLSYSIGFRWLSCSCILGQ